MKSLIYLSLCLCLVILSAAADSSPKCRALILSGDGSQSAFQVGALQAIVDNLPDEEIMYDVIAGSGTGAFNGLVLSLFERNETRVAVDALSSIYMDIDKHDFYKNWALGIVEGVIHKAGLYNNEPTKKYMEKVLKKYSQIKREFIATLINLDTGHFEILDKTHSLSDYPEYLQAAAAIPALFPYVNKDNKTLAASTSVINSTPKDAIEKCRKIVSDDSDITVDIIITDNTHLAFQDMSSAHSYDMIFRYLKISGMLKASYAITDAKMRYDLVNFRHIISPKDDLPDNTFGPLDFGHKKILEMIKEGEEQAKKVIFGQDDEPNRKEKLRDTKYHKPSFRRRFPPSKPASQTE